MKDLLLAIGTVLVIVAAFLIAGFVSAVFFLTLRFTRDIVRWFSPKHNGKSGLFAEEETETIEKFMRSENVFSRDPLQYKDADNDGVDDLETR